MSQPSEIQPFGLQLAPRAEMQPEPMVVSQAFADWLEHCRAIDGNPPPETVASQSVAVLTVPRRGQSAPVACVLLRLASAAEFADRVLVANPPGGMDATVVMIDWVYVDDAWRLQGLGRLAVQATLAIAGSVAVVPINPLVPVQGLFFGACGFAPQVGCPAGAVVWRCDQKGLPPEYVIEAV